MYMCYLSEINKKHPAEGFACLQQSYPSLISSELLDPVAAYVFFLALLSLIPFL